MKYVTDALSDTEDYRHADWLANDCCVMSWLLNSMKVKVSAGVTFLCIVKWIWDERDVC